HSLYRHVGPLPFRQWLVRRIFAGHCLRDRRLERQYLRRTLVSDHRCVDDARDRLLLPSGDEGSGTLQGPLTSQPARRTEAPPASGAFSIFRPDREARRRAIVRRLFRCPPYFAAATAVWDSLPSVIQTLGLTCDWRLTKR